MSSYTFFANWYDELMSHAPYDKWLKVAEKAVAPLEGGSPSVLDIGCGTGELLLGMLEKGWEAQGLDASADMLATAHAKLTEAGFCPLLLEADMSDLPQVGSFDVMTIFCDSLNYLDDEESVRETFKGCFRKLKQGGLLLFDVHSVHKMTQFAGATFAEAGEDVSYIWHSFAGEHPHSVLHELSFFVKQPNGSYQRLDELHKERTFEVETYERLLTETGFKDIRITADFTEQKPTERSERIFFQGIKK
ncbi:class I SAM-dependent DNA methyltransferase [Shouchella shacheensis]|uniref:class I SAM-dependent DNA methyltransferase n=1 Tax=Shouchella shacheensis TaxID=1649580 RepID=UPI00074037E6|nr:class I SAM-dependent methyltransferase [Shouchella shacheensis]